MTVAIAGITRYPVKSTAGVAVTAALVEPRGLQHDRRLMLVDADGRFLTARTYPRLLRVACREEGTSLLVSAPGMAALRVEVAASGLTVPVTVWKSAVDALAVADAADDWFSRYLGVACRLVVMGPGSHRAVDPDFGRADDVVSFADGYPILIISQASLDGLNERLEQPLNMRRFRPNLVVTGCAAHAEDAWKRIRIGDEVELELVKHCSRCVLTTIDPDTAERHPHTEPLKTLASYRRGEEGGVVFGMNAIPRRTGRVHVGDEVTVMSHAEEEPGR